MIFLVFTRAAIKLRQGPLSGSASKILSLSMISTLMMKWFHACLMLTISVRAWVKRSRKMFIWTLRLALIQPSAGQHKVGVRGCARQRYLARRTAAPRVRRARSAVVAVRRRSQLQSFRRMQVVATAHPGRSRRWSARSAGASVYRPRTLRCFPQQQRVVRTRATVRPTIAFVVFFHSRSFAGIAVAPRDLCAQGSVGVRFTVIEWFPKPIWSSACSTFSSEAKIA